MRTKHASDQAFEVWVDGADQLRTHSVQAAFRAAWEARETAPNTLILDTTNAQMMVIPSSAAAGGILLRVACPRCGATVGTDGVCPKAAH